MTCRSIPWFDADTLAPVLLSRTLDCIGYRESDVVEIGRSRAGTVRLWRSEIRVPHVSIEGYVASEWGVSDNNRRAKYYRLTRAGRKHVERAAREWEQTTEILARFLSPDEV